jgi:hypothetical protein
MSEGKVKGKKGFLYLSFTISEYGTCGRKLRVRMLQN